MHFIRNSGGSSVEEANNSPVRQFSEIEGRPSIFEKHQRVEKMSFSGPKKVIMRPKKKVFSRNHIARYFLQKNASKLVKFGRGRSVSDLHQPIGGPHPVLYFTQKYSTAMCYVLGVLECSRGERIVFSGPNTNTNTIRFQNVVRIRIRILFGFRIMAEYEYEYYSGSEIWPNTNTNIIRSATFVRIRIRILRLFK